MSKNQASAQKKIEDICQTADILARRMGKTFVLNPIWRDAFLRQEEEYIQVLHAEEDEGKENKKSSANN